MLAFFPFFLAPGYCAAYSLNLFRFRDSGWGERWLISLTLSAAIVPVLANVVGRLSSLKFVSWIVLSMGAISMLLVIWELVRQEEPTRLRLSRGARFGLYIALGWMIVAIASSIDLQIGDRLYLPMQAFDQCLRTALAASAVRTGVPPANPFFYPGHAVALRYYYYWNVLCALPASLFGLSARATTLAGIVWSGLSFAALVPLYLKYFCEETVDLCRKSIIGVALIAVTGLDLIPTIGIFVGRHTILGDMEWWDGQQVTSWIDSFLWVPHHVAAIVACLMGFLVLWVMPRNAKVHERAKAAIIAALAFASAAGLSVYVTFTFAIFLVMWTIVLCRAKFWAETSTFVITGLLTIVVSLGYLHDLQQPGFSGSFATFYVRRLEAVSDFGDHFIHLGWLQSLFYAALLPLYYTVELGFFALVGFVRAKTYWRRPAPLQKWEWAAIDIAGVSLLVGSFLMSTTGNNDLGYRSVLFAQFILLLWAVPFVYERKASAAERPFNLRLLFKTFLLVGVLGSVYQLLELRTITVLADRRQYADELTWLPHSNEIAKDVFLARSGLQELTRSLPTDTIIQYSPFNPVYVPNLYYAPLQSVEGMGACGTPFGGDPFACMPYQNKLAAVFNGRVPFTWQEANALCEEMGIDVLIAERPDRMWAVKDSWVWSGRPVIENSYLRAFACGRRRKKIEDLFPPRSHR